jgi:hypothetical protein
LTDDFVIAKLSVMGLVTVAAVAERLGVTTRQVQHLVARGELHSLARGIIDETSVDRYLAAQGGSRRRAWAEPTAWAAVGLLSDSDTAWMGKRQRARLRGRLHELSADELVGLTRRRAVAAVYAGHPSTAARLREQLVDTTRAAEALGLTTTTAVDGYVAVDDVEALVARHGLIRDDNGRFTLRATAMPLAIVADLAQSGPVLAALGLAESLDVRERRVGLDTLTDALERFRG